MTRIIHLSDLHFGAHDPAIAEAVLAEVDAERPDLVVISGDWTQRARRSQYREASAFLARLHKAGHRTLTVPGNHDIPLYDVVRRFAFPLTRYRNYIAEELCPYVELTGAAVLGLNTARSLTFKDGSLNPDQQRRMIETFAAIDPAKPRILVTHHPVFALPAGDGVSKPVNHQATALEAIATAGVDVLLSGHNHRSGNHDSAEFVKKALGDGPLVIQAGTAISTRVRGENQSFNRLEVGDGRVTVTLVGWTGARFEPHEPAQYRRVDGRWVRESEDGPHAVPRARRAPRKAVESGVSRA